MRYDTLITAEGWMELIRPDIDRRDPTRTVREQYLSKTSSRRTNVKTGSSGNQLLVIPWYLSTGSIVLNEILSSRNLRMTGTGDIF
jgi:hypothetical protein